MTPLGLFPFGVSRYSLPTLTVQARGSVLWLSLQCWTSRPARRLW